MLVANFMRFRWKRLEKQTNIDNFSLKKKNQNKFIWLLCTFWCLSILLKKSQKTRKTENRSTWTIPPFSSFLLGNVRILCNPFFGDQANNTVNIVKEIPAEIFLWKEKFSLKKFDKKFFIKKNFFENKNSKQILKIIFCKFFIFENKVG